MRVGPMRLLDLSLNAIGMAERYDRSVVPVLVKFWIAQVRVFSTWYDRSVRSAPPYQWASARLDFFPNFQWLSPRIGTATQYGHVPVLVVVKNPDDRI